MDLLVSVPMLKSVGEAYLHTWMGGYSAEIDLKSRPFIVLEWYETSL